MISSKDGIPQKRSFGRTRESSGFSAALLGLAAQAPERLTINQLAFFSLAASADLAGRPMSLRDVLDVAGERLGRGVRNTYRLFLEPNRKYPDSLGWLAREMDPNDERQFFLKLSEKGRIVFLDALDHLYGAL